MRWPGASSHCSRALLIYAAGGLMAGLAVTFSRGGWVAAAVGLLTLLLGFDPVTVIIVCRPWGCSSFF